MTAPSCRLQQAGGIFINGEWIEIGNDRSVKTRLQGKPLKTEIKFDPLKDFKNAAKACSAWSYLKAKSFEKASNPEKTFDRVATGLKGKDDLTLFVPWGVRPAYDLSQYKNGVFAAGSAEENVLVQLKDFCVSLRAFDIPAKLLVMPADIYAIEVNKMEPQKVNGYFGILKKSILKTFGDATSLCRYAPWSELRQEYRADYDALSKSFTEAEIQKKLPSGLIDRARKSATTFNPGKSAVEQSNAAFSYLRERLCEASIIDNKMNAVKLSCVDPMKDAMIDLNLPRLYVVPASNRFPWLKPMQGLTQ